MIAVVVVRIACDVASLVNQRGHDQRLKSLLTNICVARKTFIRIWLGSFE